MIPAISIVGHSRSGKTTLMEHLIRELRKRGNRLAAVKHAHEDFDLDRPGKDSHRFGEAGCESVALLGARRSALLRTHEQGYAFDDVLRLAGGEADIVLIEGLSSGPFPKIEVYRGELGRGLRCKPEDLLAVVTDRRLDIGCKQLSMQEIGAIADLVEDSVSRCARARTELVVNGAPLPLGPFTEKILANTITGLVGSLKGIGKINTLSVLISSAEGASEDAAGPR